MSASASTTSLSSGHPPLRSTSNMSGASDVLMELAAEPCSPAAAAGTLLPGLTPFSACHTPTSPISLADLACHQEPAKRLADSTGSGRLSRSSRDSAGKFKLCVSGPPCHEYLVTHLPPYLPQSMWLLHGGLPAISRAQASGR